MATITPKQMAQMWNTLPNKFEVNVLNFKSAIGNQAKQIFKQSFYLKRFNTTGAFMWSPRKDNKPHELLRETGTMYHSITKRKTAKGVKIYVDPNKIKLGPRQYGRGFNYAAVHNDPSGTHTYGKYGGPSLQRQFIGHSTVLNSQFEVLSKIIFNGFPT